MVTHHTPHRGVTAARDDPRTWKSTSERGHARDTVMRGSSRRRGHLQVRSKRGEPDRLFIEAYHVPVLDSNQWAKRRASSYPHRPQRHDHRSTDDGGKRKPINGEDSRSPRGVENHFIRSRLGELPRPSGAVMCSRRRRGAECCVTVDA